MARPAGNTLNRWAWDDLLRFTGLTLTDVAERAEIPRATLSGLVGGHHRASLPVAHRIARVLDVHPGTLFEGLGARHEVPAEVAS